MSKLINADGTALTRPLRDIYRKTFTDEDFQRAIFIKPTSVFVKPIKPHEVNRSALNYASELPSIQCYVFEIVAFGTKVPEQIPGIQKGLIAVLRNAILDPINLQGTHLEIPADEILALWNEADLAEKAVL